MNENLPDAANTNDTRSRADADALLQASATPSVSTTDYEPPSGPGVVIAGCYKLVERIGESGMGEVWVAKQDEPVKRKVAIKQRAAD